jgi:CRISPR-associated protein Csy1
LQGRALSEAGDLLGAERALRASLAIDPDSADARNALGVTLADAGRVGEALAEFQGATYLDPKRASLFNNLGNALLSLGRLDEAVIAFRRAIDLKKNYGLALTNLGVALVDLGDLEGAETALRAALVANPSDRSSLLTLGGLLRRNGRLDEAAKAYWEATRVDQANSAEPLSKLGYVLWERGDLPQARRAYSVAISRKRFHTLANLGLRLSLPMICRSRDEIAAARAEFSNGLEWIRANLDLFASPGDASALDRLDWTNFLLAYHGEDDRELQERYASFVASVADRTLPQFRVPIAPSRRIEGPVRVGFASTFFTEGTVGMYFRRWITDLAREPVEVYVYHLSAGMNRVASEAALVAKVFRHPTRSDLRIGSLARMIREDALDVLIYPEVGMDPTVMALSSLRLAPIQCAAWGHPVTTGQRCIDYFFSSSDMEPEDAHAHYTERLVLLPGLGTRYQKPILQIQRDRASFGLPENEVLLLCPQSLFKIHPDNDELFAEILSASDRSRLVLFEGRHPAITDLFMRRLENSFRSRGIDARKRTVVLPSMRHEDYLQLNSLCDLMLDTLRWSGGNTSLDAIACELPIVTLPGRFMRGRQTAGMLRLMNVEDLVAGDFADYVAKTVALSGDAGRRQHLRQRLRECAGRLFDDAAPIEMLAGFLNSAAGRA